MREGDIVKTRKIISRAIEDVRGLAEQFDQDSVGLTEVLNGILEDAVDKIVDLASKIEIHGNS